MGDDPYLVFGRNEDVLRGAQVGPLIEKFSVRIENLNPIVLAVAHVDSAFGVERDRMRGVEFARPRSGLAPIQIVFTFPLNHHHSRITVAVYYIYIAICDTSY